MRHQTADPGGGFVLLLVRHPLQDAAAAHQAGLPVGLLDADAGHNDATDPDHGAANPLPDGRGQLGGAAAAHQPPAHGLLRLHRADRMHQLGAAPAQVQLGPAHLGESRAAEWHRRAI